MSPQADIHSRIVVAIDRADSTTMDIVRCVFNESIRQLHGLFIEDTRLLEHARSRLAREVLLSGSERQLDAGVLIRQLRAQAARARREFEESALKLGVPFTFQVTRGERLIELERVATATEFLVVSLGQESTETHPVWTAAIEQLERTQVRSLLLARKGWASGKGIVAAIERTPDAAAVARLASRLAERSGSPLSLIMESDQRADDDRTRGETGGLGDEPSHAGRGVQLVSRITADVVIGAALRQNARLVIVPWHDRPEDVETLARLLRQTASAILLLK